MIVLVFFLLILICFLYLIVAGVLWRKNVKECRLFESAQRLAKEEKRRREEWENYCGRLKDWFKSRRNGSVDLGKERQMRILYALAQHNEYDKNLQFWQILLVWGWDGTSIDRLRFDKAFEFLFAKSFVSGHGYNSSLVEEERHFNLTEKGRDYLMKEGLI